MTWAALATVFACLPAIGAIGYAYQCGFDGTRPSLRGYWQLLSVLNRAKKDAFNDTAEMLTSRDHDTASARQPHAPRWETRVLAFCMWLVVTLIGSDKLFVAAAYLAAVPGALIAHSCGQSKGKSRRASTIEESYALRRSTLPPADVFIRQAVRHFILLIAADERDSLTVTRFRRLAEAHGTDTVAFSFVDACRTIVHAHIEATGDDDPSLQKYTHVTEEQYAEAFLEGFTHAHLLSLADSADEPSSASDLREIARRLRTRRSRQRWLANVQIAALLLLMVVLIAALVIVVLAPWRTESPEPLAETIVTGTANGLSSDVSPLAVFTQERIAAEGLEVRVLGGEFSASGNCWRLRYPGTSKITIVWQQPNESKTAKLHVEHLTSSAASARNGGYAPVMLSVNRHTLDPRYDVAEHHGGSHGFQQDTWDLSPSLLTGRNEIEVLYRADAETHYWIRSMKVSLGLRD